MFVQNHLEIRELTKEFVPNLYKLSLENESLFKLMEDWCRLASFLTREALVHEQLKKLNSRLVNRLNQQLVGRTAKDLKDATGQFKLPKNIQLLKLLEDELSQVEAENNFNRTHTDWTLPIALNRISDGSQDVVNQGEQLTLPSGAPTLSGFVDPIAFRKLLFQHGYHWIDPGAGQEHGAYTHRIQWYCIVKAASKVAIHYDYITLFKMLAYDFCVAADGNKTLWDLLFDSFVTSVGGVQQRPVSDTYRSPEKLHGFLRNHTSLINNDYSLLSAIIKFSHERERGDWINKLVGANMSNISLALGPTEDNMLIEGANGVLVWPNQRVVVNNLNKDVNR